MLAASKVDLVPTDVKEKPSKSQILDKGEEILMAEEQIMEKGEDMISLAWTLFHQGEKELEKGEAYEEAVEIFSQVLEILVPRYGQLGKELGPVYVAYGRALLHNSIKNRDALLNPEAIIPADMMKTFIGGEAGTSGKRAKVVDLGSVQFESSNEEQGSEPSSKGDEKEGEEDDEEDDNYAAKDYKDGDENDDEDLEADENEGDDLHLASEIFDLARRIYADSASVDLTSKAALVEVHSHLGDLAMEMEEFGEAAKSYSYAAQLKEEISSTDAERELASLHFKTAIALEYDGKIEEAMNPLTCAKSLLQHRIKYLEEGSAKINVEDDKGKQPLSPSKVSTPEKKGELEELRELLPEIDAKIEDLKTPPKEKKADLDGLVGDVKSAVQAAAQNAVQDLTALVRKRKN